METDFSAGLVIQEKKILMVFNEEEETWTLPSTTTNSGELSSQTAERAVEEALGTKANAEKYMKKMKVTVEQEEGESMWHPYVVDIDSEPEKGEWKDTSEFSTLKLEEPVSQVAEKIEDRF